jgi:hypothetical protein
VVSQVAKLNEPLIDKKRLTLQVKVSGDLPQLLADRAMLAHILAGMQYALGDLQADDSPSGPVAAPSAQK